MKAISGITILAAALILVFSSALLGQEKKTAIEVRKVASKDISAAEEWERVTTEVDVLGVSAVRGKQPNGSWRITVNAAEFVRKDPLESRLQNAIESALKKVNGVKRVAHEDREVWLVQGEASGDELVRSCSAAVNGLAEEIRKLLKSP